MLLDIFWETSFFLCFLNSLDSNLNIPYMYQNRLVLFYDLLQMSNCIFYTRMPKILMCEFMTKHKS